MNIKLVTVHHSRHYRHLSVGESKSHALLSCLCEGRKGNATPIIFPVSSFPAAPASSGKISPGSFSHCFWPPSTKAQRVIFEWQNVNCDPISANEPAEPGSCWLCFASLTEFSSWVSEVSQLSWFSARGSIRLDSLVTPNECARPLLNSVWDFWGAHTSRFDFCACLFCCPGIFVRWNISHE